MKKTLFSVVCILVLLCSLLYGCGGSEDSQILNDYAAEPDFTYDEEYNETPVAYESTTTQIEFANGNVRSNVIINGENNQVNVQNNYNDTGSAQNSGNDTYADSYGYDSVQSGADADDYGNNYAQNGAQSGGYEYDYAQNGADGYDYDAEQARLKAYNDAQQVLIDSYRDSGNSIGSYNTPTKRASVCTHCAGTGKCSRCNGTHLMHNPYTGERQVCSSCSYGECPFCGGSGTR